MNWSDGKPTTFWPNAPFAAVFETLQGDLAEWQQFSGGAAKTKLTQWAGPDLGKMAQSPRVTMHVLSDASAIRRAAAAYLIGHYWTPRPMFVPACLASTFDDSAPFVRGAAFISLVFHRHLLDDPTGYLTELIRASGLSFSRELHSELRGATTAAATLIDDSKKLLRKQCESLAGSSFDEIAKGPEAALQFFHHADVKLRRAAIQMILSFGSISADAVQVCEGMALSDPDIAVRQCAMDVVIRFFRKSDDIRIGRLLARLVQNETEPIPCRKHAYEGLFAVRGMPVAAWPVTIWKGSNYPFPGAVDWGFVDSFLTAVAID